MSLPAKRKVHEITQRRESPRFASGDELDPFAGLTEREQVFVEEYIRKGDASMAALRAGYTQQQSLGAYLILEQPKIRRAVRVLRATQRESFRQIRSLAARGALEVSIEMLQDEDVPAQVRAALASKLMSEADIPAPQDAQDDFSNDAVLEHMSSKKAELALQEYVKGINTVVEENSTASHTTTEDK